MSHRVLKYTEHFLPFSFSGFLGKSKNIPDRLIVKPVDLWPGRSEVAHAVIHSDHWGYVWPDALQDFSWLRDIAAYGGVENIAEMQNFAREAIESWIRLYGKKRSDACAWKPEVTGERLSMWIAFYEFFGVDGDEDFQDLFFESLVEQFIYIQKILAGKNRLYGLGYFQAIKGALYGALALEGYEEHSAPLLNILCAQIQMQILPDGGHVSRCALVLLNILQIWLDIRTALNAAGKTVPDDLIDAIQSSSKAIQFLRYHDKKFALFHGTGEGQKSLIDRVLAQAGVRGKIKKSLPHTGFERISLDRTTVMMDVGERPDAPYDEYAHYAPLAFELCHGKNRVFVACGTHEYDPDWCEALKASGAHNTLTIDDRNPAFYEVSYVREDTDQASLIEASHDGYVRVNGMTHTRRLYVSDKGHDVRGLELLSGTLIPPKPISIALRFHVHPKVMVSLIQDGQEALLRLPGGTGWRFSYAGGALSLTDSIYMDASSNPRKTSQLVIQGMVSDQNAEIKWRLKREG